MLTPTLEHTDRNSVHTDTLQPELDLTDFMFDGPPRPKARQDGKPDVVWTEEVVWV